MFMKRHVRAITWLLLIGGQMAIGSIHAQSALGAGAADDALNQVLRAVAKEPLSATPFVERRLSPLFTKALESRGTLTYKPPAELEKLTTSPILERVTIAAESITIQSGNATPKVTKLDAQTSSAAYAQALRAILGGDSRPLRQYFDTTLSGSIGRWELTLLPLDAVMRRGVKRIVIRGENGRIQLVETTELNGDVNELTILAR
jgi:Outer membrane lipoprotein carrier protein LolA-like